MIGGADIVIEYPGLLRASGGLDLIVRAIRRRWPDAIVQDAATGTRFKSYADIPFGRLDELFVYRNISAFDSWASLGADATNTNTMVHVIAGNDSLTVVVDNPEDATMESMINEAREVLTGSQSWVRAA